jgi:hypothetical protein
MNREIENYITNNYYELLKICKKYTKDDDWSSELLHEIIIQLYDKKEYKGKLEDKDIKYYIVRMIYVNWCLPTSPFYRKIKKFSLTSVDLTEAMNVAVEESELDQHKLLDIVELEWAEMDWFNKIIFEKYMIIGSLKGVSRDTTIPLTSIKRYVDDTKRMIKINSINKFENE